MRPFLASAALAAALVIPLLSPSTASATCAERKLTGTAIGGVGGALIGNSIAKGGAGAILGAVGGGYLGHEIAAQGGGCRTRSTRTAYRNAAPPPVVQAPSATSVYYDQYGQP